MTVGEKIRALRLERGISLRKLAEITGLSRSTISEVENQKKNPSLETMEKVAFGFGIPVSQLFEETSISEELLEKHKSKVDELLESSGIARSESLVRSLRRAKDRPKEVLDDIAEFIDIILAREDAKNK